MLRNTERISVQVLNAYFPVVRTLEDYLGEVIQSKGDEPFQLHTELDTSPLKNILQTSLVCLQQEALPKSRFRPLPPMMSIRELIDRAQERVLKSSRPQNIITTGYKLRVSDSQRGKAGRIGIVNFFVNTIVTALQSSEWDVLLQRTGIDTMMHLFTETCIFTALPNDCFCQMTGQAIMTLKPMYRDLHAPVPPLRAPDDSSGDGGLNGSSEANHKRKVDEVPINDRAMKRRRLDRSGSSISSERHSSLKAKVEEFSPADISIFRTRMYYSRPTRVPQSQNLAVGLPPKHILNRIQPSYYRKPKASPDTWVDPDPKKQAEDARHLSKYIFPRQYGLRSPFAFVRQPYDIGVPEYSDRQQEIQSNGPCKTPKRLKDTLRILERMIHRHGKCAYKPLQDRFCPSKVQTPEHGALDCNIILEMISEDASQLCSQLAQGDVSTDTVGNRILAEGVSQAQNHARTKPKFAEFACSYVEVYRYVSVVTQSVIPKAFWGSESNYKHIMKHVKTFITSRRYETVTLHYLLQGFSTSACEWLMPTGTKPLKQTRVSVSDALKRRELLEDFLFWYFDGFVISLLRTTFYITESSAFRNKTLYIRHDDWGVLCTPLIERLTSTTFQQIPESEAEELLRQRKLGFSFVRLLPKDTGVRPIVNLRRKVRNRGTLSGPERSINQILQAAFHILSYEKTQQPTLLGASVFSPDEIHHKLLDYKKRLPKSATGKLPKLYFVKLDVQACFDTIEQSKLLDILRSLVTEDRYMLQRYGQVSSAAGRVERRFVKRAISDDDQPHFIRYATELAGRLHGVIFADQTVYPHAKRDDILRLLEEHITENIVKIGNSYYRQMVGIPQGSILSTLLCSFFYGDMENRFPKIMTEDTESLLLRMIDDYLFITTSLPKARCFLDMMLKGHPEYGCFVAKQKTMTNFDHSEDILNVVESSQRSFPWCGLMINMSTLSVTVDYSRSYGTNIQNTLSVDRGRAPGKAFMGKMIRLVRSRRQMILYDPELSSDHDALLNAHQHLIILAMKMYGYVRNWGLSTAHDEKFLYGSIRRVIQFTATSLVASRSRRSSVLRGTMFTKSALLWLGAHAFYAIFSAKRLCSRAVIDKLKRDVSVPKYRLYRKRLRRLVTEGMSMLAPIHY